MIYTAKISNLAISVALNRHSKMCRMSSKKHRGLSKGQSIVH